MNFSVVIIKHKIVLVGFMTNVTRPLGTFFLHMLQSYVPLGIVFPWDFLVAQKTKILIIVKFLQICFFHSLKIEYTL